MENNYVDIINRAIIDNYLEALVIDVINDKVYKYVNNNGNFIYNSVSSYNDYFNSCNKLIYKDDLQEYVKSLSISTLNHNNNYYTFKYRRYNDTLGTYMEYVNNILLYNINGNNMIVVLVSLLKNNNELSNNSNNKDKMVNDVSLELLKIHNVINMDNEVSTTDEYINSIITGLANNYPEFKRALKENAMDVYNGGKSTIMIVDDDTMTCTLISKIFEDDYNIIIANNGAEAVDLLNSNKDENIGCVFLDLLMPGVDGFGVLDYLNENNYLKKIPVVIISGNYDKDTRDRAYSYDIADMLDKPFSSQVVKHRINKFINLYRSSSMINKIVLEQHANLKNIIKTIVDAYLIDNNRNNILLMKYVRILAIQVVNDNPGYNIIVDKLVNSSKYYAIGNYLLPRMILGKKYDYNEDEINNIKMVSIIGADIIKYVVGNIDKDIDERYCYDIVRYRCERYDGKGYPDKLQGDAVPVVAQIVALANEYMNLVYMNKDMNSIVDIIVKNENHKYNPQVIASFKKVVNDFANISEVGE